MCFTSHGKNRGRKGRKKYQVKQRKKAEENLLQMYEIYTFAAKNITVFT